MEDYAEYLLAEARSDVAALHQFRLLFKNSSDDIHLFFEGEEDSLFYMPEVRRLSNNREIYIYDCGGKRNVIDVRDLIKNEGYQCVNCMFFVDRDYDDYIGTQVSIDELTYITDYYSIESYISSVNSMEIVLQDIIRLSRADLEFTKIADSFNEALESFYLKIRPLAAWIIAAKEDGCKPNLSNTKGLKGIIQLNDSGDVVFTEDGFKTFKRNVLGAGGGPALRTAIKWRRLLEIESCKLWTRGKYDIWFFRESLLRIVEFTNARRKAEGSRIIRIPASLRDGQLFEILGGRVRAPDSLIRFLNNRLLQQ